VSSSLQSKELNFLTAVGLISLKQIITRYRSEDGEYEKIYGGSSFQFFCMTFGAYFPHVTYLNLFEIYVI